MHSTLKNRNFNREHLVTLSEIARMLTLDMHVMATTMSIERLTSCGCKGIKLETILLNGARHSSIQALEHFCGQLAAQDPRDWPYCLLRCLGSPTDK